MSNFIDTLKEGAEEHNTSGNIIYLSDMSSREDIREVFSALEKGFFVMVAMNATSIESAINQMLYGFEKHEQVHIKSLLAHHLISIICEQNIMGTSGSLQSVYEVLLNNSAVQSMFMENKLTQLEEIFEAFPGTGMCSMDNAVVEAVVAGRITKDDAIALAKKPGRLMKKLNGVN